MKKLIIFFILLLPVCCNLFAEGADSTKIELKVIMPDSVLVNQQFKIIYEFNSDEGKDLKLPDFPGIEVIAGPYTSSSVSIATIGGKTTKDVRITYTIVAFAEKEGAYELEEASIKIKDTEYKSDAKTLKVVRHIEGVKPSDNIENEIPRYRRTQPKKEPEGTFI